MFPKANYMPTGLFEITRDLAITLFVRFDFSKPKIIIAGWNVAAFLATVPKTSIYKHCYPVFIKNKIRLTHNV